MPLIAALFVFGCCVLPFHGLVHRALPLCHSAAALISHLDGDDHHDASTPAQSRPEPSKRVDTTPSFFFSARFTHSTADVLSTVAAARASSQIARPRNAVSLGALRVDDDVGLSALLVTYRI